MASPFPGMDPYLEGELWQEFHETLAGTLRADSCIHGQAPRAGSAPGTHNLRVAPGTASLEALLRQMGRGFMVTELLGHGVNPVTGDYSRGAAGFWVEHGEIQFPVEEITIAGNLKEMYKQIVEIGNDVLIQGSRQCGSVLVERMSIAGS